MMFRVLCYTKKFSFSKTSIVEDEEGLHKRADEGKEDGDGT